jgi:hypothetical protein
MREPVLDFSIPVFEGDDCRFRHRVLLEAEPNGSAKPCPVFQNSRARIEQPERHVFGVPPRI